MKRRPPIELTIDVVGPGKPQAILASRFDASIDKDFDILETLGRGSIGIVRHARRLSDGSLVALKMVSSSKSELVAVEHTLLTSIEHPNIIKCYDRIFYESANCEVLVFEHFEGKTLQKAVSKSNRIGEETARRAFFALLGAVAYLHGKDVIHRDVKADNVLISQDFLDLRLIDFNTARRVEEGQTPLTVTGTRSWSAPEVLLGESPGKPNDVWGVGLCLHFMMFSELPYRSDDYNLHSNLAKPLTQVAGQGQYSSQVISKECMTILRCCLETNPIMRAKAHDLLQSDPCKVKAAPA